MKVFRHRSHRSSIRERLARLLRVFFWQYLDILSFFGQYLDRIFWQRIFWQRRSAAGCVWVVLPGVVFISQAKRGIRRTLCFGSRFLKYRCNFCGENSKRRIFSKSYITIIISDENWDDFQRSRVGQSSSGKIINRLKCTCLSVFSFFTTENERIS